MEKFDYISTNDCCSRCGLRAKHRNHKACIGDLAGHAGAVMARIVACGAPAAIGGLRSAIAELEFALAVQKLGAPRRKPKSQKHIVA